MDYYRVTEIKATAYRVTQELAEIGKALTYDNVLEFTAYALGIEMDDNDDYPAELCHMFNRVWAELNN